MTFFSACLKSSRGFSNGTSLDKILCKTARKITPEITRTILKEIVMEFMLPLLKNKVELAYFEEGNPIRAISIDGVEVNTDLPWNSPQNPPLTPEEFEVDDKIIAAKANDLAEPIDIKVDFNKAHQWTVGMLGGNIINIDHLPCIYNIRLDYAIRGGDGGGVHQAVPVRSTQRAKGFNHRTVQLIADNIGQIHRWCQNRNFHPDISHLLYNVDKRRFYIVPKDYQVTDRQWALGVLAGAISYEIPRYR